MDESNRRGRVIAGRIVSGLAALFLLFDGVAKLFKPAAVLEAMAQLGYPDSSTIGIGLALIVSTLLYAIPRTAILGAVLVTGYLGGAVATHVRASGTAFEIVFPVIFGVLVWGGLWLRHPGLRKLLPLDAS